MLWPLNGKENADLVPDKKFGDPKSATWLASEVLLVQDILYV
jgi:hypothetical protein